MHTQRIERGTSVRSLYYHVIQAMQIAVAAQDCDRAAIGVEGEGHRLADAQQTICTSSED
jgi:hypothetical protein